MTRDEVDARARALYGEPLGPARGILHVVAVARVGGALRVIRIGEHAPASPTDAFALTLARARVDAILVSGGVLRAEPALAYAPLPEGFAAIRGERGPPWLCVLTERGAIAADHPVWSSAARLLVYAGPTAELEGLPPHVEVVRAVAPSARGALRHLLEERGCASVSVEAGPRVAVPLYEEPSMIDELALSVFEGALDPRAIGGAFVDEGAIASMALAGGPTAVDEPSGRWAFARYLRRGRLSRARRGTAGGSR